MQKGYYYLNTLGLNAQWSSTVSNPSVAHLSFRGNKLKTRKSRIAQYRETYLKHSGPRLK